jgi:transcriptional regulator CtsR
MAMLYVYPKRLGLMTMAPGFIVNDQFSTEEGGGYLRIMKSRDNDHHLDKYELAELRDQLQVAADAAYLWKDTLST